MKYIVAIISLLVSTFAYAEGKLTFDQPFYSSTSTYGPEIGLYVREDLDSNGLFHYQSWTGGRVNQWYSSNQAVYYSLSKTTEIGIGPSYQSGNIGSSQAEFRGSVLLQQKLW